MNDTKKLEMANLCKALAAPFDPRGRGKMRA